MNLLAVVDSMTQIALAVALAAGVAGYIVGTKLRHHEPGAPAFCFIVAAIAGYFFTTALLYLTGFVAAVGLLTLLFKARVTVRDAMLLFSHQAGVKYGQRRATRPYGTGITKLHEEHRTRIASIMKCDVDLDTQEELLEKEDSRYTDALKQLDDQQPSH